MSRSTKQPTPWRTRLGQFEWKASPYLYIAPFFLLFAVVGLFPLLFTVYIATRQYNTLTGDGGVAICGATCNSDEPSIWANFNWVLHQQSFWDALRNSFSIFILSSVPQIILALFLAWILNANLKAKTFWRMGVLLPYIVAPSAAGIIFSQIFSDKMGAINVLLTDIGLNPIMWHGNTFWSHVAIATIVNFRWTGYNTLIFLAAMQAIPNDVLEAAVVDGAGKWRTFRSVVLPMLRPTLIFVIITSTIGGLQIDEPQMFHNGTSGYGGPNRQYLTLSLYLWDMGFNKVTIGQPNLGRAAAVAWILFLIIVLLAVLNFWLTQRLASGGQPKIDKIKLAELNARQEAEYEMYGKGVARSAAKQRRRKTLEVTSEGRRAGWGTYAILVVTILIFVFPLYVALSIASQSSSSTQYGVQALIFGSGLIKNISRAFGAMKFWQALSGTLFVAIVTSVSTVFFSTLAGYSFSKLRFRGRGVLFTIVIGTMTIPQQLSIVPLYIMANKAGLFGSIWAVIIPGLVSAFGVFWMTQYLQDALPYELIEAARVDGCSMFRTFISVAVPAARPAAAMLFLFTFIAQWTNYFWPMLILGPNKNSMLTVAAATLKGAYFTDYTIVMAGVVLTTFPLILLFAVAGKQLVSGIMAGAVKG